MIEFVKLETPIQLVPKEYRLEMARIAAQLYSIDMHNPSPFIGGAQRACEIAQAILFISGLVEAKVPKQHAEELV